MQPHALTCNKKSNKKPSQITKSNEETQQIDVNQQMKILQHAQSTITQPNSAINHVAYPKSTNRVHNQPKAMGNQPASDPKTMQNLSQEEHKLYDLFPGEKRSKNSSDTCLEAKKQ